MMTTSADHINSGFLEVQLKTSCKVDITLFPFDYQNCEIQFGSWIYQSDWIEYQFESQSLHENLTTSYRMNHSDEEFDSDKVNNNNNNNHGMVLSMKII
uniref:Neurotransmitter-gated ion-channel ligand-binding domain-containing protein n=1 Tax=Trichobilharzia regenti TaxID=157069 RepID=A0AA85KA18_TRIRE|nr:unnamed protein product [Trichobilharzia regenti]